MNTVYVSRDDLIDLSHLDGPMPTTDNPLSAGNLVVDVDDIMRIIPDLDVVKVIRCMNCDYRLVDYNGDWWCKGWGIPAHRTSPWEFCSKGTLGAGKICKREEEYAVDPGH